jgi:hypothetical protein
MDFTLGAGSIRLSLVPILCMDKKAFHLLLGLSGAAATFPCIKCRVPKSELAMVGKVVPPGTACNSGTGIREWEARTIEELHELGTKAEEYRKTIRGKKDAGKLMADFIRKQTFGSKHRPLLHKLSLSHIRVDRLHCFCNLADICVRITKMVWLDLRLGEGAWQRMLLEPPFSFQESKVVPRHKGGDDRRSFQGPDYRHYFNLFFFYIYGRMRAVTQDPDDILVLTDMLALHEAVCVIFKILEHNVPSPDDDERLHQATTTMSNALRTRWPSFATSYVHDVCCHIPQEIAEDRLSNLGSGLNSTQAAEHLNKLVHNAWRDHTNKHLHPCDHDNALIQVMRILRANLFGLRELVSTDVSLQMTSTS